MDRPDRRREHQLGSRVDPLALLPERDDERVRDRHRPSAVLTLRRTEVLAHGAKQTRKATLSADKAVELAPKNQRKAVRDAIKQEQTRIDGLAAAGQPTGQ